MSLGVVRAAIERAAAEGGRDPAGVVLVAVSKGRSVEEIGTLYARGHRDFGENRAAELAEKASQLPSDIRWHFVGHLQSNKVRSIRHVVEVLHSLDRDSLAKAWLKGPDAPPAAFVQVNIGEEPQKSGISPDGVDEAVDRFVRLGIDVIGLMAILPIVASPVEAVPYFERMVELRDNVRLRHPTVVGLSMGMSDDYEEAVARGATVIRVGRAIFDTNRSA